MQSTKGKKVTLRPNNLITSVLAKPVEAGKCRQVCAYYLSDHSLYKLRKFNHSKERFWRNTVEIHLRSLIGACLCMCLYMNSAVLMRENVAEKMYVREQQAQIIRLITTWIISEHRYSCDWKTSAQSNQKIVSKRIMPPSLARRNLFCLSRSL